MLLSGGDWPDRSSTNQQLGPGDKPMQPHQPLNRGDAIAEPALDEALQSRDDLQVVEMRGRMCVVKWTKGEVTVDCMAKLCHNPVQLKMLSHPQAQGLVPFLASLSLPQSPYSILLLDPCITDLQKVVSNRSGGSGLCASWVSWVCVGVVTGLAFLHSQAVAHRALRLDHILIAHSATVQLTGLHYSTNLKECVCPVLDECTAKDSAFWSVEMFGGCECQYGPIPADMYALGVVVHLLLVSRLPWPPTLDPAQAQSDRRAVVDVCASQPIGRVLQQLLLPSPTLRPTAVSLLYSNWLAQAQQQGVPSSFLQMWPHTN